MVSRNGQDGHVQRLADVASVFRAAGMVMKEAATGSEIEEHKARQKRQRALKPSPTDNVSATLHGTDDKRSTVDPSILRFAARITGAAEGLFDPATIFCPS